MPRFLVFILFTIATTVSAKEETEKFHIRTIVNVSLSAHMTQDNFTKFECERDLQLLYSETLRFFLRERLQMSNSYSLEEFLDIAHKSKKYPLLKKYFETFQSIQSSNHQKNLAKPLREMENFYLNIFVHNISNMNHSWSLPKYNLLIKENYEGLCEKLDSCESKEKKKPSLDQCLLLNEYLLYHKLYEKLRYRADVLADGVNNQVDGSLMFNRHEKKLPNEWKSLEDNVINDCNTIRSDFDNLIISMSQDTIISCRDYSNVTIYDIQDKVCNGNYPYLCLGKKLKSIND